MPVFQTADEIRMAQDELTQKIISSAFKVSNTLGAGFVEKVYENALIIELKKLGLLIDQQYALSVNYEGANVGDFYADIVVQQSILVELKSAKQLTEIHAAQCLNYLKATNFKICLLINFGNPKVEIKRIVNHF